MTRHALGVATPLLLAAVLGAACSGARGKAAEQEKRPPTPIAITTTAVAREDATRFIRVTGSLTAEEQAEVAAETAGRVVATPVERGSRVSQGAELIRLSPVETEAQLKEAEANAAQIEVRLALGASGSFNVNVVPEVATAKSAYDLAQAEFSRIRTLLDQRVVSQSEYDQRQTQVEAARQQLESARNVASQQFQALQSARARVTLARKSAADTVVKAPFSGLVAQRLVSVGDYVSRGTRVAQVVRIDPLRVELTVPEQFVSQITPGQVVRLAVDAYPDRQFDGRVRFVSPSLRADQRAMTVEALVPNPSGELKPGFFVTAEIQQPKPASVLTVPTSALVTAAGTSRVFVVKGDRVEERIVTLGQSVGRGVEITKGLAQDEVVATSALGQLADGALVRTTGGVASR